MARGGDVVVVDFPGAQGIKRRPALVISSEVYHQSRPDIIVGLITSQVASATGLTDFVLQDWKSAGLHSPSAFRTFLVTLPRNAVISQIGTQPPPQAFLPSVFLNQAAVGNDSGGDLKDATLIGGQLFRRQQKAITSSIAMG